MVSNADFDNRLLEGEHYAQLAAEMGHQHGWCTERIVSNPLAVIHPQIPEIVTPADEDDEKTPEESVSSLVNLSMDSDLEMVSAQP